MKPQANRLVQRVESASPSARPSAAMSSRRSSSSATARSSSSTDVSWNSTAKTLVIAIRLCTR
jgi:hypothetical protein